MRSNPLLRGLRFVWRTVEEPRAVTVIAVLAYAVAVWAGVGLIVDPPAHPLSHADAVLRWFGAAALITAGVLGAPAAWAGKWWLERVGATAALAGLLVTGFEVAAIAWPGPPDLYAPGLTVPAAALAILAFAARLSRVVQRPYAPGRGPELPEHKAQAVVAKIIAETA